MLRTVLVYLLQRDLAFKKIIFQLCRFKLLFFFFFLFSRITVGVLSLFTSAHILETCFFFLFFFSTSLSRGFLNHYRLSATVGFLHEQTYSPSNPSKVSLVTSRGN